MAVVANNNLMEVTVSIHKPNRKITWASEDGGCHYK